MPQERPRAGCSSHGLDPPRDGVVTACGGMPQLRWTQHLGGGDGGPLPGGDTESAMAGKVGQGKALGNGSRRMTSVGGKMSGNAFDAVGARGRFSFPPSDSEDFAEVILLQRQHGFFPLNVSVVACANEVS